MSLSSNPSPSTQAFGSRCWSTGLCSLSMCWRKTAASTCVESAMTSEPMSANPCISTSRVSPSVVRSRISLYLHSYMFPAWLCSVLLYVALRYSINSKAQRLSELNFVCDSWATSKMLSWPSLRAFCLSASHESTTSTAIAIASLGDSTAFIRCVAKDLAPLH